MPETPSTTIKNEIVELERLLQEKRASLEGKHPDKSDKELLHQTVGEKIEHHVSSVENSPIKKINEPKEIETPSYLDVGLAGEVREAVKIALEKGLEEGVKMVKVHNNSAVMDAFHDILTDELYDRLVSEGKLEKVD